MLRSSCRKLNDLILPWNNLFVALSDEGQTKMLEGSSMSSNRFCVENETSFKGNICAFFAADSFNIR